MSCIYSVYRHDAAQRWLRELNMAAPETEEWPAPKGSVADLQRPQSPTGVSELLEEDVTPTPECIV